MFSLALSEEQRALQKLARDFAEKEIRPRAHHHDETGEYPREIIKKAFDLGLLNTVIPEAYGGVGLSVLDEALISEELAWGCSGVATAMLANTLAEAPVVVGGSEELKQRVLGRTTTQFTLAAYCVTEPGAGSDVQALQSTAVLDGDAYVLNGQKMWITNASVADWYFVLAYTDKSKGARGMSGFVVDAKSPGVIMGKKEKNLGQRCSDTRGLSFEDVRVPVSNRVGGEGEGFKIAMAAFDHTRPLIAAMAVGVARAAMEYAGEYATQRKTFGTPIIGHQGIAFMLAEMAMNLEAARLLAYQAAWTLDVGKRNTLQAAYAKAFAADMCMKVTIDAVQVFGGYGFNAEYPVEKLMRDAKIFQIYEGTSQIQRLIIARELFGKR